MFFFFNSIYKVVTIEDAFQSLTLTEKEVRLKDQKKKMFKTIALFCTYKLTSELFI